MELLRRTAGRMLILAAVVWTLGTSAILWSEYFKPAQWRRTATGIEVIGTPLDLPLIDGNQPLRVTLTLAYPVLVAAIPLAFPRLARHAAIILAVLSVLSAWTLGLYYMPAAVLLFLQKPPRARSPSVQEADNSNESPLSGAQ